MTFSLLSQQMMTLSAISYVSPGEGRNPSESEIVAQLDCACYATEGDWNLAWGPAFDSAYDNMMCVVRQGGTDTYALVLRGTVFDSLRSWLADVPTGQVDFSKYTGGQESWVSNGFYDAFIDMLKATSGGQTLAQYLAAHAGTGGDITIYVTGHSQGAGLVPLFVAWVQAQAASWQGVTATVAGHGFAPPSAGDKKFAAWIEANAECTLYANPNDIVPFAYDRLGAIVTDDVPTSVPMGDRILIDAADAAAWLAAKRGGGSWAQAGTWVQLPGEAAPGSMDYFDQVEAQHNHNTYLHLMAAAQTTIPTSPSPLTPTVTPECNPPAEA